MDRRCFKAHLRPSGGGRRLKLCGDMRRAYYEQDMSYQNSWSWFLKPRAQAKEKKLLENFHAAGFPLPKGFPAK